MNLRDGYIPTHPDISHGGYLSDDIATADKNLNKRGKGKKFRRPPPLPIGYNEHGIDETRKVLYRNFHEVSGKLYLIEISKGKTKVFICLFENYQSPDEFIALPLSEKLAFYLMNKHENLFEKFVESFYITYGKL